MKHGRDNRDIHSAKLSFQTLDMAEPPFSLPVETVFKFYGEKGKARLVREKVLVQVLRLKPCSTPRE